MGVAAGVGRVDPPVQRDDADEHDREREQHRELREASVGGRRARDEREPQDRGPGPEVRIGLVTDTEPLEGEFGGRDVPVAVQPSVGLRVVEVAERFRTMKSRRVAASIHVKVAKETTEPSVLANMNERRCADPFMGVVAKRSRTGWVEREHQACSTTPGLVAVPSVAEVPSTRMGTPLTTVWVMPVG